MDSILVTGGHGFLGTHLVAKLRFAGYQVHAPTHKECDLLDLHAITDLLSATKVRTIIHAAARVGGIGANQAAPADFGYLNTQMGLNCIEAARVAGTKRFILIGTVCAYPAYTPVPFKEDALWEGYPEPTNAPYGVAKRALTVILDAYARQYGIETITFMPTNLYGPGDCIDNGKSHVIPALINRVRTAILTGQQTLTVWGSGRATRDFLHVQDCVDAIVHVLQATSVFPYPVMNIGSGKEVSIAQLVSLVANAMMYKGQIVWDPTKPDGQLRRVLDISRMTSLGWIPNITLQAGIPQAINDITSRLEASRICSPS